MKRYRKNFTKVVYGFYEVEADSIEEAESKFENGDYDQFDNKSEDETDEGWEQD